MKRIVSTLFGLAFLCLFAEAQAVPSTVSFTGRLSTSNGPVTGQVNLVFTLYNQASGGTSMWSETRNGITATAGLVYVDLGAATTLDEMVFANGPLFLEIVVAGETLSPRLPIQAVPYAIRSEAANTSDTLGTITPNEVVTTVNGGGGVNANRTGNTVSLSVDSNTLQTRVNSSCTGANQSIKTINANGTTTCETDDNTTYSAGQGIAIAGTTIGLTTCAAGQVLKAGSGGTWACGADVDTDTDTTYSPRANGGLTFSGTQIGLTNCAVGQVLKSTGTNTWGCAADTDTNTTYSLSCTNATVSASVAAGTSGLNSVACPSGFTMMGGGCDTTGGPGVASRVLFETYPSGNGWACGYFNSSTTTALSTTTYARCCQI